MRIKGVFVAGALIMTLGGGTAGKAEVCPSVEALRNGIPEGYVADWDEDGVEQSVTEWSHAEYATLRGRVFCHYESRIGDWSIYVVVGDISEALNTTPNWRHGKFDGGSYWTCQGDRQTCNFPRSLQ